MSSERQGGVLLVRLEDNSDNLRVFRYTENVEEGRRLASEEVERDGTRAVYVVRVESQFTKLRESL